jgi:Mrp family chromosome partitioning ATPase
MGRMLDALRRANHPQSETDEQPSAKPLTIAALDAEPMLVGDEEIPFIEVGPRKSMEASPSVLACAPVSPPHMPFPQPPAAPSEQPPPVPRSVHFRAVSNRPSARSRFAPELVAYHAPDQRAARQYREVFDAVRKAAAADDHPAALLFTPALPRSGNTTTLLNVALTAACQERRRVVVVDANLRQPAIAERLGLPAAPGLREALAGAATLDDVLQATEQPNLFALTAGVRDAAGVRFVAETMRSLLRQLRQRFPLVFVDGPRWDGRPDATALGAACDAVFLVTPEQEAETPQTDALLRLIPEQGARLAGCILVAGQSPFS